VATSPHHLVLKTSNNGAAPELASHQRKTTSTSGTANSAKIHKKNAMELNLKTLDLRTPTTREGKAKRWGRSKLKVCCFYLISFCHHDFAANQLSQ
jgi:hypothetical protein